MYIYIFNTCICSSFCFICVIRYKRKGKYDIKKKNWEKSIEMTGVYHKITQSLENSWDSFSFDEMNYLDEEYESIPSLLCHNEYLEPKKHYVC